MKSFKQWCEVADKGIAQLGSEVFNILSNIPCEKEFAQIVELVKNSTDHEIAIQTASKAAYDEMMASLKKVFIS